MHPHLLNLRLHHWRNYPWLELACDSRPVILHGANGAGKTNILEAISMLAPGRGLRGVDPQAVGHHGAMDWQVGAMLAQREERYQLGTALSNRRGRLVRIDGNQSSQSALAQLVQIVWLTPAMDRLFNEAPSVRRRFLDRLVMSFDYHHPGRCAQYEQLARERLKLLSGRHQADPLWLDALEMQMASIIVAIAAARRAFIKRLNRLRDTVFARVELIPTGSVEQALEARPALEVEEILQQSYRESRSKDRQAGRTRTASGHGDFQAIDQASGQKAASCSTGQQKICLIAVILAYA
ncbi:MAG: DNA replication and repair protein RecF, partial [Pseudomonadota bacterium]